MVWLNWTSVMATETKLLRAADRLAATCQEQVWRLVQTRALAMSPAEARGYVRARAGLLVKHAVEAELARSRQFQSHLDRLLDLTTEQVVRLIGAQLRALRPGQRSLRRAA
jgi:hypothetical protein